MSDPETNGGPARTYNSRSGVGLHAPAALRISGADASVTIPSDFAPILGRTIAADEELVVDFFPVADPEFESRWAATAFCPELIFDSGETLSQIQRVDRDGVRLSAHGQARSKRHYVDQWNRIVIPLQEAAGRVVTGVIARTSGNPRTTLWLDPVAIRTVEPAAQEPLSLIDTRRGSHASFRFSRGNTAPLVGLPHGGVFGLPMTDASASNWPYSYHEHNVGPANRPALQAFATSHIPSPWIGDRGVFQLFPSPLEHPDTDRQERALTFEHAHEQAGPDEYRVVFDAGITAAMTAADFALAFRFTGDVRTVILDHQGRLEDLTVTLERGSVLVHATITDPGSPLAHHVCAVFPEGSVPHLDAHDAESSPGFITVPSAGRSGVEIVLGISTISREQAASHALEAGRFEEISAAAAATWAVQLEVLEVPGLEPHRARELYSDLYRLFLYPNRHDEPSPQGGRQYRSPADQQIRTGSYSANNGFWDTYRTSWPAYSFLSPHDARELAQGFVQQFTDSGWTTRWSAPGPVDCMTGTTTDTVFADLQTSGGGPKDVSQTYASAFINATTPAADPRVGRKGLAEGRFQGFISTDTAEGLSWTLDNAINDVGVAILAAAAADMATDPEVRLQRITEAEYFSRRALNYRTVFHTGLGFFLGRKPDGHWRSSEEDFDPDVWGFDYTETNAWGTAFTAPHDGAGLARIHGGEQALGEALDAFFARPETADESLGGSYGFVIHEQTEARDVRMGMLGLSNQPAHHIPFMYCYAGRHDYAHRIITEARDRLFRGTEIGQGFPGDEDNGEMSGWHLFTSLGFYPLVPGSDEFILVPPQVPKAVLRPLGTGKKLTITTLGAGQPYIQSVSFNGVPWNRIGIPRTLLAQGGLLEFVLAAEPQGWAEETRPFSLSGGQRHPVLGDLVPGRDLPDEPWKDVLAVVPSSVTDNRGAAPVKLTSGDSLVLNLEPDAQLSGLYTVTLQDAGTASWMLEIKDHDGAWQLWDKRQHEFTRDSQLVPFRAGGAGTGSALRFTALADLTLVQVEALL